jgi:hypothetical protein
LFGVLVDELPLRSLTAAWSGQQPVAPEDVAHGAVGATAAELSGAQPWILRYPHLGWTGNQTSHVATTSLTITGSGGGSVVTNGSFETGNLTGWTAGGAFAPTTVSSPVNSGSFAAQRTRRRSCHMTMVPPSPRANQGNGP